MYETFEHGASYGNDDDTQPESLNVVLEKFRNRCVSQANEAIERYNFFRRNQDIGESMNSYVTAVMKLSNTCNFGGFKDDHVRDRLVHGICGDTTRRKLLGKKKLTLTKCLETLRSSQVTSQQAQEIACQGTPPTQSDKHVATTEEDHTSRSQRQRREHLDHMTVTGRSLKANGQNTGTLE